MIGIALMVETYLSYETNDSIEQKKKKKFKSQIRYMTKYQRAFVYLIPNPPMFFSLRHMITKENQKSNHIKIFTKFCLINESWISPFK